MKIELKKDISGDWCLYRWMLEKALHREDGPAYVNLNKKNVNIQYYDHDHCHRIDGPYFILENNYGKGYYYCLYDVEYSESEYYKEIAK